MALNVGFAPDSDRIADIAEGPSCARSGLCPNWAATYDDLMQQLRNAFGDRLQAQKQVRRVRQKNEQECVHNVHAIFKQLKRTFNHRLKK